MNMASGSENRSGIGLGLAGVLVLAALLVGAAGGLTVGAVAGYVLGRGGGLASSLGTTARTERVNPFDGEWPTAPPDRSWPRILGDRSSPTATPRADADDRAARDESARGGTAPDDSARGGADQEGGGAEGGPAEPGEGVERPYLGVEVPVATGPEATPEGGTPGPTPEPGAEVLYVQPGTAAERAGLAVGDRIVAFDGEPIASGSDLAAAVARCRVGQVVVLEVVRDARTVRLEATLGPRMDVLELVPGAPGLEDLLEQMPEEWREPFRQLAPTPEPEA